MLTQYIKAALKHARYELIEDGNSYYGEIQPFQGVYAVTSNLETCRNELEEVLEKWIFLRIYNHLELPVVDGLKLEINTDIAA